MPKRRAVSAAFVCIALLAAGCTDDKKGTPNTLGAPTCKAKPDERPAKAVLRCTEKSVAYVETETSSGTGVVVAFGDKKYLLTNEHVIDPFDSADAVIAGKRFDALPVVGIDASADIALLGPFSGPDLTDLPPPLAIDDGTELERGDDVFLVGYPGESEKDALEATIASGIVSRLRTVQEFESAYIQTDASIAGGQSGGPLFDSTGKLVGISGLSFAEEFALALTGRDVKTAAKRIVDRQGDEYRSLPATTRDGAGATSGSVKLFDASDGQMLFLPAADTERSWHLTVDMSRTPVVIVETPTDEQPIALSSTATDLEARLARELADARGGKPEDLLDPSASGREPKLAERETAPGRFAIPVERGRSALVTIVAPLADGPLEVGWQSDLALLPASAPVKEHALEMGGRVDHIFSGFDTSLDVLVDLVEGQEVEMHARSPQGDPGFMVFDPTRKLDHLTMADPEGAGVETFDDTDDGLYGVDARTTFTPKTTGTHRIQIYINDTTTVRVRFSVVECTKTKCDDDKEKGKEKEGAAP